MDESKKLTLVGVDKSEKLTLGGVVCSKNQLGLVRMRVRVRN